MKHLKQTGTIPRHDWDEDYQEWSDWDEPVYRRTIWGWLVFVGREFLYRTHLRKRPALPQLLAKYYLPAITDNIYNESVILKRLHEKRRG